MPFFILVLGNVELGRLHSQLIGSRQRIFAENHLVRGHIAAFDIDAGSVNGRERLHCGQAQGGCPHLRIVQGEGFQRQSAVAG